jgi:acyl-CoA synthetase (AMP-forming)/AMP-acid ligase II
MEFSPEMFHGLNDQSVIIDEDHAYSYSNLSEDILSFHRILQNQVASGSKVALISVCSYRSIAWLFALTKNNNIVAPLMPSDDNSYREKLDEFLPDYIITVNPDNYSITKSQTDARYNSLIDTITKNQHAGLVLFSSGTTGKPKAILHDLTNLIEHYQTKKPKHRIFLLFLLFDHIGGLNTIFKALFSGGCLVIPGKRNPETICRSIEQHRVQILPVTPGFLNLFLLSKMHEQFDISSLQAVTYGTESMPLQLLQTLRTTFPTIKFIQTFGTSETGIIQLGSFSGQSTAFSITDPDVEYKIENQELLIRNKFQFLGYLNNTDPLNENAWYSTGDIVEELENGMLRIVGRKSDIINVGGQKVFPEEIEFVVRGHEFVKDCKAYGIQNTITGQIVVCDIVISNQHPGTDAELKQNLRSYCVGKLDRYKVPVKFNIVDEIQRNANQKIKRNIS